MRGIWGSGIFFVFRLLVCGVLWFSFFHASVRVTAGVDFC
jgi:hypothetical protein